MHWSVACVNLGAQIPQRMLGLQARSGKLQSSNAS
jgi:hypothetical protein